MEGIEIIIERKKKYLLQLQEKESPKWLLNSIESEIIILSNCLDEIQEMIRAQKASNEIYKKEIEKLEKKCFKLELIAFTYGIDNLKELINRPLSFLIAQYKTTMQEGFRFFPIQFFSPIQKQ